MNRAGVALLFAAVVMTAACSGSDPGPAPSPSDTLAPGLDTYTDRGDGCPQVVSAIGYADQVLRPRGQEDLQTFDDSSRSRLAAVGGTIALELDDLPSAEVAGTARALEDLAEQAAALIDEKDPAAVEVRLRTFERYRSHAARLIALCRETTRATSQPTSSGVSFPPSPIKKLPSTPATEPPTIP